jgi:hypothetical protein
MITNGNVIFLNIFVDTAQRMKDIWNFKAEENTLTIFSYLWKFSDKLKTLSAKFKIVYYGTISHVKKIRLLKNRVRSPQIKLRICWKSFIEDFISSKYVLKQRKCYPLNSASMLQGLLKFWTASNWPSVQH